MGTDGHEATHCSNDTETGLQAWSINGPNGWFDVVSDIRAYSGVISVGTDAECGVYLEVCAVSQGGGVPVSHTFALRIPQVADLMVAAEAAAKGALWLAEGEKL